MKHNKILNGHSKELNNMLRQPMGLLERWGFLFMFLLSLLLLLGIFTMHAQTAVTTLRGCVKTDANSPVSGINVFVSQLNQRYKILGASLTDKNGMFSVSFHTSADSVSLFCSGMTINKYQENVSNKDAFHTLYVEEKTQKLKEITVKAQKIYMGGDTINYNVASFLNKNDQSIAEVLKRMPGITVLNTGQIAYKGLPIKNLYIEGLDLMKGRYGIATNNVDPNSISTVQVLENHQEIKALKKLRPEERASINLKLKEGVKGVFNLIGVLGAGNGNDALWKGELLATYFKKNSQLLAMYKGNNIGEDLEAELRSFDGDDYARTINLTGIEMPSAPGIAKRYYYFNRSNSLTFNNIYRLGKDVNLGINLGGLSDRDRRNNQSFIHNLLPDGTYHSIVERISAKLHKEIGYGDLALVKNSDKQYVKESLTFDYSSFVGTNRIENEGNILQSGKIRDYRLHNELHLTSKFHQGRGVDFVSKLNIEKRPQNLFVDRNLFPDILTSDGMNQWVESKNVESKNLLGILSSLVIGNLHISPTAFCDVRHDNLESTLEGYKNLLALTEMKVGLGLGADYKINKLNLDVDIPLGYRYQQLNDQMDKTKLLYRCFNFEPSIVATYYLNASHSFVYHGSLSNELPTIGNLYAQYILNNYRQLSCYATPSLYEGTWVNHKVSYHFKNIFKMFFVDVDLAWNSNKPKILYGSTYDGVVEKVESQPTESVAKRLNFRLNTSKGFDWKKTKIALMLNYAHVDSPILLQGEELNYSSNTWSVKMDASATIMNWLVASHESSYYCAGSKMSGNISMASLRSMTNDTSVDFLLPKGLSVSTTCSHYYNSLNEKNKSFVLCGVSGRFSCKKWLLTLDCSNIFNKKNYSRSNTSALTERISEYSIRQRSVLLTARYRIL